MKVDYLFFLGIGFLILFSLAFLKSIAPFLFPLYFLYVILAVAAFFFFMQFDFDVISLFSKHFYVASIFFLILTILIGQVTRGAIRWIPIGPLTLQPAELVRPLLLVFFANYLAQERGESNRFFKAVLLFSLPLVLILVQPALGMAILTGAGFLGVLLASDINKKYIFFGFLTILIVFPIGWSVLASYQRQRLTSFINPSQDPLGAGYNSLQAMISVGSGKLLGRGLGKGVETQLAFLPERHTDFIFAAVSEELGFVGASLLVLGSFLILSRLIGFMEKSVSPPARAYLAGLFLTLFAQVFIHIGMNVGLLPITGLPYPLVSAGGSSLLGTMIGLGIALGARRA